MTLSFQEPLGVHGVTYADFEEMDADYSYIGCANGVLDLAAERH